MAMCSALCNESTLQYNPDKGNYEKIGESTEVALRVLAEKVCIFSTARVSYVRRSIITSVYFDHLLFVGWSPWFQFHAISLEYVD